MLEKDFEFTKCGCSTFTRSEWTQNKFLPKSGCDTFEKRNFHKNVPYVMATPTLPFYFIYFAGASVCCDERCAGTPSQSCMQNAGEVLTLVPWSFKNLREETSSTKQNKHLFELIVAVSSDDRVWSFSEKSHWRAFISKQL